MNAMCVCSDHVAHARAACVWPAVKTIDAALHLATFAAAGAVTVDPTLGDKPATYQTYRRGEETYVHVVGLAGPYAAWTDPARCPPHVPCSAHVPSTCAPPPSPPPAPPSSPPPSPPPSPPLAPPPRDVAAVAAAISARVARFTRTSATAPPSSSAATTSGARIAVLLGFLMFLCCVVWCLLGAASQPLAVPTPPPAHRPPFGARRGPFTSAVPGWTALPSC
jgi:hypothetical protein